MINITGYVLESHGTKGFTIKITDDDVKDEKGKHPNILKEVRIKIHEHIYPADNSTSFVRAEGPRINKIDRCMSISRGLREGDMVECCAYLVNEDYHDNIAHYKINSNKNDILTYTNFDLLLHPFPDSFERLDIDTPKSLKFRRYNYYLDENRKKYEEITGDSSSKYKKYKWMYKNPKRNVLRFVVLRIKTLMSNLWGYLSVKNMTVLGIILSVPLAILGIVATILVAIIFR